MRPIRQDGKKELCPQNDSGSSIKSIGGIQKSCCIGQPGDPHLSSNHPLFTFLTSLGYYVLLAGLFALKKKKKNQTKTQKFSDD